MRLSVFRAVTPDELQFLEHFKSGEFLTDAGATILQQGASSPHLFTVLSGWAFRYKTLPDGRRQILNFVLPGDFLGMQASMFSEMQHSVEALTPMVLCIFPRDKLWSLYSKHPSLAYDLTWLAARSEASLDETLLAVGRRSALERVAWVLLELYYRAKALELASGNRTRLPITQQHLADALGLSLVHTNKTLQHLSRRKLLRSKAGELEILDEPRLGEIGQYDHSQPTLRPLI